MTGLLAGCLALAIACAEQARLGLRRTAPWAAPAFALGYGMLTYLLAGSAAGAAAVAGLGLLGASAAELAFRRRGPSLGTAFAVVASPYAAAWAALAALRPAARPRVAAFLLLVWARAGLGGPSAPGVHGLTRALAVAAAYVFCGAGATFLTRSALDGYAAQFSALSRAGPAEAAAAREPDGRRRRPGGGGTRGPDAEDPGLLRAGRLIGELERFLTLSLALTGNFTAIGFVVAAKSVARFDLARRHGEYFLVGTLCSIGTAVAAGLLASRIGR